MEKVKQYVLLTVLGAVVILAAGWFLLVSPKKTEAADLQGQTASQRSSNAVLATQLEVLKAQAKDLPKKQAELAAVAAKIPDNPSLPAFIRALSAASAKAGVEFVSVTPGAPVAFAAPAAATPEAPTSAPATGAGSTGSTGDLAVIPIDLNVVGDYFEIEQFMAELESLPRAMRVTNLSLTPGTSPTAAAGASTSTEDGRSLTSTITGSLFMAAGRPAQTAAVVPAAAGSAVPAGAAVPADPNAPAAN